MYSSPDFPTVQEVQRRLEARLASLPTAIAVDTVGQAQRVLVPTERTMRHGVEIPVTTTEVF